MQSCDELSSTYSPMYNIWYWIVRFVRSIVRLILWFFDCSIDRQVDWLIDWLIDWLMMDWSIDRLIDWLIDWLRYQDDEWCQKCGFLQYAYWPITLYPKFFSLLGSKIYSVNASARPTRITGRNSSWRQTVPHSSEPFPWRVLRLIGGVDLSCEKSDQTRSCAALVICALPDLEVCCRGVFFHFDLLDFLICSFSPGCLQWFHRGWSDGPLSSWLPWCPRISTDLSASWTTTGKSTETLSSGIVNQSINSLIIQ